MIVDLFQFFILMCWLYGGLIIPFGVFALLPVIILDLLKLKMTGEPFFGNSTVLIILKVLSHGGWLLISALIAFKVAF